LTRDTDGPTIAIYREVTCPEKVIDERRLAMSVGLLMLRLVVGLSLAAHGAQKLFGWFGGYGLTGTGQFLEQLGFRPGRLHAAQAGLAEFLGGLFLAAGFLTPLATAAVLAVMLVAT